MSNNNADRLEKFKSITTEVFALTLGLGAFSLSSIPLTSMEDVVVAIGAFAIAFMYVAMIWIISSRFFEAYPLYDDAFLALDFVMLFLVALGPFIMRAIFFESPELQQPMSVLYGLDLMGTYAILGFLHQKFIWQNRECLKPERIKQVKMDRNMQFVASVWFLVSTVIPIPYRFVFWTLAAAVVPVYRHVIAPYHVK